MGVLQAPELLVELAQCLQGVGALEARVVRDLVVAGEGRVHRGAPLHHVGEDAVDDQVAHDHAQGGPHERIQAAAVAEKGALQLLAVTVLTSNDTADLAALGVVGEPADIVIQRARVAQAAGIDGVVCSGADLPRLRAALGRDLLAVCPGIRPAAHAGDDQKRTVDVPTAFAQGANYIVVGRPIRNAPDPAAAAAEIVRQIEQAVG